MLCAYTSLPKNTLIFVNLDKILKIVFGEDLEFIFISVKGMYPYLCKSFSLN